MYGKTKTFSRVAGILNVAAALFLVIVLVLFLTAGNFGIAKEASQSAESDEDAAGQAVGIIVSVIFLLPLVLILLIPLGLVNVISGLAIGSHCFKAAPGTGTVVFSLILKILTAPVFAFADLLLFALGDVSGSSVSALFPTLIAGYVLLLIVAHVFEWLANRSAVRSVGAPSDEFAK